MDDDKFITNRGEHLPEVIMARTARKAQRSKRDRFITDRLVDRAIDRHLAAERIAQQQAWEVEHGVMSAVEGEVGPNGWLNVSYA